jgi:AraC-like DNA-binding protein
VSARYAEHAPPPELAEHVACLWTFEGDDAAEDQRIVPDGRCELIVHYKAPYLERAADGRLRSQPAALFAGQLTRPLHIRAAAQAGLVGVRFRTAGAAAYAGAPLSRLTDQRVDLCELKPGAAELAAGIAAAPDEASRLAAAAAHVWREVRGRPPDPGVVRAVALLRASEGRAGLDALAEASGRAPRALQRAFAAEVGIPPRTLRAVIRVRRLFDALQAGDARTWSAAAQAAGYFDHPQMARDFRRFVGCTPSAFLRGAKGLATSLVEPAGS